MRPALRMILPVIMMVVSGVMSGCAASANHAQAGRATLPAVSDDAPRIVVETFNVNFGMSGDPVTVQAVAQHDADVIFLQETTEEWEQAIRSTFAQSYPHMRFKQQPPAGGLAVISRFPIESIEYLPPTSWFPAARVVLQTPMGRVQVLNVHLRPPVSNSGSVVSGYFTTKSVREEEIAVFVSALDPSLPTLIVGDFNEGEHGRAVSWLNVHGYRSALPEFQPQAKTWRWATSVYTLHGDYDHLCYDARLRPIRAEVRDAGQSDHLPVVGVFTLAANPSPATTQPSSEHPQ